ncbi:DNA damage-binding protein 1a, partial [Linderina pennispora]
MGEISVASSLTYLSDGCLYVGSHFGDQQLVRLHIQALSAQEIETAGAAILDPWSFATDALNAHPLSNVFGTSAVEQTTRVDADTFVEPLESFQNLAPIMDLCVVGMGEQQQEQQRVANEAADIEGEPGNHSQSPMAIDSEHGSGLASSSHGSIVTCSGMRNKPSLRMVRNGVGIDRIAGLDIKGLLGVWSFTARGTPDLEQVVLVLSLFSQTLVLGWTEPSAGREIEMNELDVGSGPQPGWRTSELTLAVGLTGDQNHVIQVTPTAVTLIGIAGWQQRAVWTPESGAPISVASVSGDQIAVVIDGKTVGYLEVRGTSIVPVALRELGQYVSCIDVHSWDRQQVRSSLVAIGLWGTNDIQLLQLPSLETHPAGISLGMRIGTFAEPVQLAPTAS